LLPLAALLVGIALGWGTLFLFNPSSEREALKLRVTELEKEVSSQKTSRDTAVKELTNATQVKTALQIELTHEKEKNAKSVQAAVAEAPKPRPFEDMMRQGLESHLNNRIGTLAMTLGLTSEQVDRLKLAVQNAKNADSSKPDANPMMAMGSSTLAMNKELEAMLNPEQKTAYEEFEKRERSAQLEAAANMETSQIQSILNLTPEQTDQAFNKFVELQENQIKNPVSSSDPGTILGEMMARKKEALRGVLNDDQFKLYDQYLSQQQEMALKMMPALQQSKNAKP